MTDYLTFIHFLYIGAADITCLVGVGWLLGMNLLHIRGHLLMVDGIKGVSHLNPPGCLLDLVSWWGILLLGW